jgi:hypothetical protein
VPNILVDVISLDLSGVTGYQPTPVLLRIREAIKNIQIPSTFEFNLTHDTNYRRFGCSAVLVVELGEKSSFDAAKIEAVLQTIHKNYAKYCVLLVLSSMFDGLEDGAPFVENRISEKHVFTATILRSKDPWSNTDADSETLYALIRALEFL